MDPIKEYFYIALALGVVVWGVWFAHHERDIQAQKDTAAIVAAEKQHAVEAAKVLADATATIQDLQVRLATTLATPPKPHVIVRMCDPDSQNGVRPPVTTPNTPSDGATGPGSGMGGSDPRAADAGDAPDIAGATEAILAHDGAVIRYLQGYIRACQKAGRCQMEKSDAGTQAR
jgi:hypothetical protein